MHPVSVTRDSLWAAGGAAIVTVAALVLAPSAATATTSAAAHAATGRPAIESDPTSPLGDLTPFAVIVDDVAATAQRGDLAGATSRVKDLEVAWDDAEAAMKPTSPSDWHTMDDAIDQALTAVRAARPTQQADGAALAHLQQVIGTLEAGK